MTNTNNKLTKAIKLGMVLEFLQGSEVQFEGFNAVEFLQDEIALINKRNQAKATNKKPSKTQVENEQTIALILSFLNEKQGQMLSAKEICELVGLDFSSQKMTALMKKMVDGSMVLKGNADSNKKHVGYGVE